MQKISNGHLKTTYELAQETPVPEAQERYFNAVVADKNASRDFKRAESTYELAKKVKDATLQEEKDALSFLTDCINCQN